MNGKIADTSVATCERRACVGKCACVCVLAYFCECDGVRTSVYVMHTNINVLAHTHTHTHTKRHYSPSCTHRRASNIHRHTRTNPHTHTHTYIVDMNACVAFTALAYIHIRWCIVVYVSTLGVRVCEMLAYAQISFHTMTELVARNPLYRSNRYHASPLLFFLFKQLKIKIVKRSYKHKRTQKKRSARTVEIE